MRKSGKGRRAAIGLSVVIVAALAIHGALWRAGAQEMRRGVEAWIAERRAEGLEVEHGPITMRGYPLILRAHAPRIAIGAGEAWRWRADSLDIDLAPNAVDRLTFRPRGEQTLEAEGFGRWRLAARGARAVLANDTDRLWLLTVAAADGEARNGRVSAALGGLNLEVGPRADNHDQIEARLRSDAIRAAFGGDAVEAARVNADIGVSAATALATGGSAAWRAAGGSVMLHDVDIIIEGAEADLSGILALDASGVPAGVIDADVKAPAGLARALGKAGVLSPEAAEQAEAGLAMASLLQGGRLKGPLVIRDGEITLAGVRLGAAEVPR